MRAGWLAVLVIGCAVGVLDAREPGPGAEDTDKLQMIIEQQQALKADLEDGDSAGLTKREISQVSRAQTEVFALTEGKARMSDLSIEQKIRLENALERINALVKSTSAARGEQNVCWRERITGSTMQKTRCGTEAERDLAREGARDYLERPRICTPPGCGD